MAKKKRYMRKEVQEMLNNKYYTVRNGQKYGEYILQASNSPSMGRYRIICNWYKNLEEIVECFNLEG